MINSLSLTNWKSHGRATFNFEPGVNVIIGPMGAGKSSILQAITFALFGTFPEVKSRDVKITELITRGPTASQARVDLSLLNYKIIRNIDKTKGTVDALVIKDENRIAGPKPTEVTEYVKDLLKIDEDTFLRTVYARQNDIDLFLKFSPGERKRRIDELMKLDKFELARKSATKLSNRIQIRQEESMKFISDVNLSTINRDLEILKKETEQLELNKSSLKKNLEESKIEKNRIREKLVLLQKKKSENEMLKQKRELLTKEAEYLTNKISGTVLDMNISQLLDLLSEEKNSVDALRKEKQELQEQLEEKDGERSLLEKQVAVLDSKKGELLSTNRDIENFENKLNQFKDINIEELESNLEEVKEKQQAVDAKVNEIIESLSKLKDKSVCPTCDTKLTEEKKKEIVSKRKEEIASLSKESREYNQQIAKLKEQLKSKEQINDLTNRLAELKRRKDNIEKDLNRMNEIKEKKNILFSILDSIRLKIKKIEQDIEISQKKINELIEKRSLYEAKDRLNLLKENLKDIEIKLAESSFDYSELTDTENRYASALKKTQELSTKAENIDALVLEKNKRLAELKDKIVKISNLQKEIESAKGKVNFLKQFNNALLNAQESLRRELISSVNEVMEGLWGDLYPYDKWIGIRLLAEKDYILQLQEATGEWLSVAGFASGGERMLAALAMRIAFAKVLSPGLSMLILDEPTHNLDEAAVKTFIDVVENKLSNYLNQIFIITHDEKLAEIGNSIVLE